MTRPGPVESLSCSQAREMSGLASWVAPPGCPRLRAYNLLLTSADGRLRRELAVKHSTEVAVNSYLLAGLFPATQYSLTLTAVCVFETLQSESETEVAQFCSLPAPPTNLSLETRAPTSLTVRWDPAPSPAPALRYRLSITATELNFAADHSVPGDRTTFQFSKLPEVLGTGIGYCVKVESVATPVGAETEVVSTPLTDTFTTKPLPPHNFQTSGQCISFSRSPTPAVR